MPSTPPTITADTTNNTIMSSIALTFTDDAAWRAAITAVKVDGNTVATANRTIASGLITIINPLFAVFEYVRTYSITIEATGYDTATVSQDIIAANWNDLVLFGDASESTPLTDQRLDYENVLIVGLTKVNKSLVNDEIHKRLFNFFYRKQITIAQNFTPYTRSASTSAIFVLDHIANPKILNKSCLLYNLYILLNRNSVSKDDQYYIRKSEYKERFETEMLIAAQMLEFDSTILAITDTDSEVRLCR